MLIRDLAMVFVAMAVVSANANAQHDPGQHGQDPTGQATPHAKPVAGPHGGPMQEVGPLRVETVVAPGGLRLFVYDRKRQPLDVQDARGLVAMKITGDAKRYRYDLFPEIGQDKRAKSLAVAVDLSKIAGQKVDLVFQLVGMTKGERRPAQFTASVIVPMSESQKVAAAIQAQGVCPVSGQPLGSMGEALPVTIGEQTVYVCCAGCIDALKANAAKYVAKPLHTVTPATEADAAASQDKKSAP